MVYDDYLIRMIRQGAAVVHVLEDAEKPCGIVIDVVGFYR